MVLLLFGGLFIHSCQQELAPLVEEDYALEESKQALATKNGPYDRLSKLRMLRDNSKLSSNAAHTLSNVINLLGTEMMWGMDYIVDFLYKNTDQDIQIIIDPSFLIENNYP
ncbi:MAG: hypothetical protein ACK5L5_04030 [Bacteroidales bacterium]